MFLGQYPYRLDNKGRVPLPPRYRDWFKGGLVLARGVRPCVELHPKDQWDDTIRDLFDARHSPDQHKDLARYVFATAQEADMDAAGRVIIPPAFRDYASLRADVVVIGAGRYLEVWDLQAWQQGLGDLEEGAKGLLREREARG